MERIKEQRHANPRKIKNVKTVREWTPHILPHASFLPVANSNQQRVLCAKRGEISAVV